MGKINVYLPQSLEDAVRGSGLNVSAICQNALREALRLPNNKKEPPPCEHGVVLRRPGGGYRCEICKQPIDIRAPSKRREAS